jgi:hypothetical protein
LVTTTVYTSADDFADNVAAARTVTAKIFFTAAAPLEFDG